MSLETFQRLKKQTWKHLVLHDIRPFGQMFVNERCFSDSHDLMSWGNSLHEGSYNVRSYWDCWVSFPCPNMVPHVPLLQDPHCSTTILTILAPLCFEYITHLWIKTFVLVPPLVLRPTEIFLPSVFSWKISREQPSAARIQEHVDGLFWFATSPLLHTAHQSVSTFFLGGIFSKQSNREPWEWPEVVKFSALRL